MQNASMPDPSVYPRVFRRLCHLMALSDPHDIDRVVQKMIELVYASSAADATLDVHQLQDGIHERFSIRLNIEMLQSAVSVLCASGGLAKSNHPRGYIMDRNVRLAVRNVVEEKRLVESEIKRRWFSELNSEWPDISQDDGERLWKSLRSYMAQAFHQYGAQIRHLLSPESEIEPSDLGTLHGFRRIAIDEYCEGDLRQIASKSIVNFFLSDDELRNRHISELIDGTVTLFSLGIDDETARYLRSKLNPVKVYLDTNYVYGILDLHKNPLDSVAIDLMDLVRQNGLSVQFGYHDVTLHELQYRIGVDSEGILSQRSWSLTASKSAMATAALSGLEMKFHEFNISSGGNSDPYVWMARYRSLENLLGQLGLVKWSSEVRPLANGMDEYEVARRFKRFLTGRPVLRTRSDLQVLNDARVWLAVEGERSKFGADPASPLDAGCFLLTVDSHFQAFDTQQLHRGRLQSVLFPPQLRQLLLPFIANHKTDTAQQFFAMFSGAEIRVFSREDIRATQTVLQYLNQYGDGLDPDVATSIMANEVLLAAVRNAEGDADALREIVDPQLKSALEDLVRDKSRLEQRESELVAERKRLIEEMEGVRSDRREAESRFAALSLSLDEVRQELGAAVLREEGATQTALRLDAMNQTLQLQIGQIAAEQSRFRALAWEWGGALVFTALGLGCILYALRQGMPRLPDPEEANDILLALALTWTLFGFGWFMSSWKLRSWLLGSAVLAFMPTVLFGLV